MRLRTVALALVLALAALPSVAVASHDANHTSSDAIRENSTSMKNGIVETLATWIPFVILFTLLGVALAAIGIDWAGIMRRHGPR